MAAACPASSVRVSSSKTSSKRPLTIAPTSSVQPAGEMGSAIRSPRRQTATAVTSVWPARAMSVDSPLASAFAIAAAEPSSLQGSMLTEGSVAPRGRIGERVKGPGVLGDELGTRRRYHVEPHRYAIIVKAIVAVVGAAGRDQQHVARLHPELRIRMIVGLKDRASAGNLEGGLFAVAVCAGLERRAARRDELDHRDADARRRKILR